MPSSLISPGLSTARINRPASCRTAKLSATTFLGKPITIASAAPKAQKTGVASIVAKTDVSKGTVKRREGVVQELIEEHGCLVIPGVYDALSVSIVKNYKQFHSAFVSGFAVSASSLGKPDIGLLTPPELAAVTGRICDAAGNLPILADADTGGGSAVNVARTVKDLIKAGAKGCFIEDQVWPKKGGHMRGKQVIPMEDMEMKIRAARAAIGGSDFFLVARTDARAISSKNGLEMAIERVNAYHSAGADGTFIDAPRDRNELVTIGKETKGYRVANMIEGGVTPILTDDELQAMGFSIVIHPLSGLLAATKRLQETYGVLANNGSTLGVADTMFTDLSDFNDLLKLQKYKEFEDTFSVSPRPE